MSAASTQTAQPSEPAVTPAALDSSAIDDAQQALGRLQREIRKVFIGQEELCRTVLIGLLARGNLLIEGPPGLGKTLLVRVLSEAVALRFARIQFTPDLMPADITGTQALVQDEAGKSRLEFRHGPVFAHIVLADEINRATPKTQSALLEAMQEHAVTIAGTRYVLEEPFCVIATQNPIEMEGTYPLPEAQLDRFLLKACVKFPSLEVLRDIGVQTTARDQQKITQVMDRDTLLSLQDLILDIVVAPHVADAAAKLTVATHPDSDCAPELVKRFVRYGASPRAMQALLLAGRAHALLCGRSWVGGDDLRAIAHAVLRHRMILGFDAELEGVTTDQVVTAVLDAVASGAESR